MPKRYTVVDAHCDTAVLMDKYNKDITDSGFAFNLKEALKYKGYTQFFAAWVDMEQYSNNPTDRAIHLIELLRKSIKKHNELIEIAYNATEARAIMNSGRVAAILCIEDGVALNGKLERLENFYNLGIRLITLTWNNRNSIADGALVEDAWGLTQFGRQVVAKINSLGIIIDVAHLAPKGFYEVLELSNAPIIASHTCMDAICKHPRNLTDHQCKELTKNNGVIGITLCTSFLNGSNNASIYDVVFHIEHLLDLVGDKHIALGSDFDGACYLPEGLATTAHFNRLFDILLNRGIKQKTIESLAAGNMLRIMNKILK